MYIEHFLWPFYIYVIDFYLPISRGRMCATIMDCLLGNVSGDVIPDVGQDVCHMLHLYHTYRQLHRLTYLSLDFGESQYLKESTQAYGPSSAGGV